MFFVSLPHRRMARATAELRNLQLGQATFFVPAAGPPEGRLTRSKQKQICTSAGVANPYTDEVSKNQYIRAKEIGKQELARRAVTEAQQVAVGEQREKARQRKQRQAGSDTRADHSSRGIAQTRAGAARPDLVRAAIARSGAGNTGDRSIRRKLKELGAGITPKQSGPAAPSPPPGPAAEEASSAQAPQTRTGTVPPPSDTNSEGEEGEPASKRQKITRSSSSARSPETGFAGTALGNLFRPPR